MSMLNQEELKQVGEVVKGVINDEFITFEARIVPKIVEQVTDKVVEQVGEMLEFNILPQLDELKTDVKSLKATAATLPTKEYIDDKLGGLRAEFSLAQRGAAI